MPQKKRDILAIRSVTRINVTLALSYVKLLLSSSKICVCNLKVRYINKQWGFLWHKLCSTERGFVLYCYERDFMSNLHNSKQNYLRYLSIIILTMYSPLITLNLRNILLVLIYIQWNKAKTSDKDFFLSWFKYKSNLQWRSYQRLRQMHWLRISYRQFHLVEWWCS